MQPRPDDTPGLDGDTEAGVQAQQGKQVSPSELIADINQKMLLLGDALNRAKDQIDPQDGKNFQQVFQGFQGFVEGLSQPKGAVNPEVPQTGNRPMEAGIANVQPAL